MTEEEKMDGLAESLKKYGMAASDAEAISRADKIMSTNKTRVREETKLLKNGKDGNMESNTYTKEQLRDLLQKFADKFSGEMNKLIKRVEEQDKIIEKQQKQIEKMFSVFDQHKGSNGEEKSLSEMMQEHKSKEADELQQTQVFESGDDDAVKQVAEQEIKIEEEHAQPQPSVQPDQEVRAAQPQKQEAEKSDSPQSKFKNKEFDLAKVFNVNK